MALPEVVHFEGLGRCFYRCLGYREPRRNEFYLSGAVVEAWRAPNDLSTKFHVVAPTHHARAITADQPGDPVRLTPGGIPLPRKVPASE